MEPSGGLPPSSSKYRRERRDLSQKPPLDPNFMSQLLFLINQDPRDLLQKLDALREHISRSCEISEKPRERPLQPVSRRTLSTSSFGHHQNHASAFPEVRSPGNHFSPHHVHSLNRHYLHGEYRAQSCNEKYRKVRVPRDPSTQYSMRSRENNASCSNYGDSHHRLEDNSYFAPAQRSLLGLQDYDQRSVYSSRAESVKRRAKRSYLPMNGASPFAICDACFALLQLPSGIAFNRNKRSPQYRCGSCSEVTGLNFPKGKHNFNEKHLIWSSKNWNDGSSSKFSREMVYSKDVKPVSLSTSHDFEEREYRYGLSDTETPKRDMNGRDFLEGSSGTYEARDVSVNETSEDAGERNMVEDLEKNETESCIEDVKKTVEIYQLADAPLPGENLGVTSVNEEMEMKAEMDRSTEPVEIEVKDDFKMSTAHGEENLIDTSLNESLGNMEEMEMPIEDAPVEVEKSSADTVAFNGNTENKEEMENSVGDTDVTSEVDSVNSHSINSSSFRESGRGSFDVRLDEEQSLSGKNGDSFFGGLVKRHLFNRSAERAKCRVWVNGRPISDRAVKRAEKKAGPIDPGDYWYDYRAGFWGVMGHQCLGIIPPFIKDFNYPMLQNCAGGITGVLVNGRELHQKDLDVLVGRGLPSVSGRSYVIEMSGKVVDEATGRELRNLGKLAPTIEVLKRGFGMLVPPDMN
ncbi:Extra-large guanine nucleotide-binding protein 1 [Carex littledalei]|uniref:Extra-large guanine nucleotide-binding protein 1 n=1 Tax=Carex littledalei TaxID=544730 RepID=A0A833VDK6_9POAL|nr:Extra-large guanine nucleotide-binding protein 1 [Carex littledalei]